MTSSATVLTTNDEFTIRQFVTNTCDNSITAEIKLVFDFDGPSAPYISVDGGSGIHRLSSGERVSETATISFGNDTPADFSAKDVVWKVGRPE